LARISSTPVYFLITCNGFYMEIFEARVLWENLYLHQRFSVQSGVLPVYYSDDDHAAIYSILLQIYPCFSKLADFLTKN
jgi:hypothetical protein